ncbi:MAG: hypothetical protein GWP59_03770 [Chlamydiales bacterium]|nr:esterase family protein [Chlamydiales bacterium]NCF70803.1 hypothetical protein [Chlamydiales bacterium]
MDIKVAVSLSLFGACCGLWTFRQSKVQSIDDYKDMLVHIDEVKKALNTKHLSGKSFADIKATYIHLKKEKLKLHPCFSRKLVQHTSHNKGRTNITQKEMVSLIYEDLDFLELPDKPLPSTPHTFFRFLERISIFYADREPNEGILIPSPDGEGFLEVIRDFSLPEAISATLYKKVGVSDPRYYLVLRGTGVLPEQTYSMRAVEEDCKKTIGQSSRKISWESLSKFLPKDEKLSLIGMSLGGAQAMILYSKYPEKFSQLVTVNSPYVSEEDNERLKRNCKKARISPSITALQTYGDYVQDLGVMHLGAGLTPKEGSVVLYLLKEDDEEGLPYGKEVSGLFDKRYNSLCKAHQKFSPWRTLLYALNLIWHLRDMHQKNITRSSYIYERLSNESENFEKHVDHRHDFRMRFEKTRRTILFPLERVIIVAKAILNTLKVNK